MVDTREKVFEALHTGTISALGSMYKWIVASILAINAGALITLTQQPVDHFLMLRSAGFWFSLGVVLIIMGAFGAIVAALGGFAGVTNDEKELPLWIGLTLFIGILMAAIMPLASVACFVSGGVAVLRIAPDIHQPCGSTKSA